jgi:hypothetical protein
MRRLVALAYFGILSLAVGRMVPAVARMLPSAKPIADVNLAIIEYRVLPQVGQVRLTTGYVHDPAVQNTMLADLASFDRQGLIVVAGDSVRRFNRREMIGSHSIETALSVYPAIGHGYRGGLATATVVVIIDGKKRVDAPYDGGPVELADVAIQPLDGVISIRGTCDNKTVRAAISLDGNQTIDTKWLTRNAR